MLSVLSYWKCCNNQITPTSYEETVPGENDNELTCEKNHNVYQKEQKVQTNSTQNDSIQETKIKQVDFYPHGKKNSQISFGGGFIDFSDKDTFSNHHNTTNKILISGELFFHKELLMESTGLKNSLRNKHDSKAFFGIADTRDYTDTCYNDFILNLPSKKRKLSAANSTGRVFEISYSKITNDFSLSVIHTYLTLYYQIENLFFFKDNKEYLLRIGKILVLFYQKEHEKQKYIEIDIQYENKQFESHIFPETQSPISIGRTNCILNINHPSVSKNHAIIEFSTGSKTFYYKDLKSTNGSILIMKEEDSIKIKGEMKFKVEDVPFKLWEMP